MAGMLLSTDFWRRDTAALLRNDLTLISKYVNENSKVLYLTRDGHYASLSGRFNSVDERFVSWPTYGDLEQRIAKSEFVLLDRSNEQLIRPYLNRNIVFLENNEWIVLYQNLMPR
jgi:hypothetical protein